MLELKKRFLRISHVFSPAILVFLLIKIISNIEQIKYIEFYLYILTFSAVLVLFNISKLRHGLGLSLIYSAIICFFIFFISLAISSLFLNFIQFFFDENFLLRISFLETLIPVAVISPILMFLSLKILFKIQYSLMNIFVLFIIILALLYCSYKKLLIGTNLYIIWQIVTIIGLQILFLPKKTDSPDL